MIVEGLSMGFAFDVREKGGSSASGWSKHGIWTPLCGLLLKVCNVKSVRCCSARCCSIDVQDCLKIATGNSSVVRSQGKQIRRERA